jgi:hypothetical protein
MLLIVLHFIIISFTHLLVLLISIGPHSIHASGFRSLAENEAVEYAVEADQTGRIKAVKVTGPNGAFVQGAQRIAVCFPSRSSTPLCLHSFTPPLSFLGPICICVRVYVFCSVRRAVMASVVPVANSSLAVTVLLSCKRPIWRILQPAKQTIDLSMFHLDLILFTSSFFCPSAYS